MAVKKRKILRGRKEVLAVTSLESLIQRLNPLLYGASQKQLQTYLNQLLDFLAGFPLEVTEISANTVDNVHNCFLLLISSMTPTDQEETLHEVMKKIYLTVIDTNKNITSAMSTAFVMFGACTSEFVNMAALMIVGKMDHGAKKQNLQISLSTFYRWLSVCNKTQEFGIWVMAFIRALEANNHFEILADVTVEFVKPLFTALIGSLYSKPVVEDVIFHILSSLRHSEKVLEKIAECVPTVLIVLAHESNPWSRQVLHTAANVLNAVVQYQCKNLKDNEQEDFKKKYEELLKCLERHMASTGKQLDEPLWENNSSDTPKSQQNVIINKIGLFNKGNTCYLNSVVQALFLTREFSNYVMLKNNTGRYWWHLAITFAKLLFSQKKTIIPDEILNVTITEEFTTGSQHDSSEFLVFLFRNLQQHDTNMDFFSNGNMAAATTSTPLSSAIIETNEDSGNEKLTLPLITPVGSSRELSSSKRQSEESINALPIKRPRRNEINTINPTSILDDCFAGIQVTHVRCTICNFISCTEDKFRDLQLAYPEKTDNNSYNVQDLLDFYCSAEILSGDNKYDCPKCQDRMLAHRSVTIEIAPRHLILVLKHFKYDPKETNPHKLNYSTYYNYAVSLPTLSENKIKYNMYAAIIHVGPYANSGHYYTVGKDVDQWYRLDDDKIKLVKESDLTKMPANDTPYMLFYRREDCEDVPPPSLAELPPNIRSALDIQPTNILYSPKKS